MNVRRAIALAALAATATAGLPAANANTPGVGVEGCVASSVNYVIGTCVAVVLGGYYWLELSSSGGPAYAEVNCSRGGSGSASLGSDGGTSYDYVFSATGDCYVVVQGEYSTSAKLYKF